MNQMAKLPAEFKGPKAPKKTGGKQPAPAKPSAGKMDHKGAQMADELKPHEAWANKVKGKNRQRVK